MTLVIQDIGEEFVEFFEKELNIGEEGGRESTGQDKRKENTSKSSTKAGQDKRKENATTSKAPNDQAPKSAIDDIEDMLAKLKKEMGR